jgi:hypothetical protein
MTGTKLTALGVPIALLVLALAALVATNKPAEAATDKLPDLGMAKLNNIQIQNTNDQRLLRFDTVIVNTGAGSFELHGSRLDASTDMTKVTQRIYNDAGGYRDVPTTAQMYWSGDGHNHWHVRDLEEYELIRLDNGKKVGTGAKQGFCFRDNYEFGSTQDAYYTDCGHDRDALEVRMGLSRGWGDIYTWKTVGQYIDITNLKSGRYRLQAMADAGTWFEESDETNNVTWVNIRIKGSRVSVIKYGPAAEPISG